MVRAYKMVPLLLCLFYLAEMSLARCPHDDWSLLDWHDEETWDGKGVREFLLSIHFFLFSFQLNSLFTFLFTAYVRKGN